MTHTGKHSLLVVDDEEDLVHSVKDLLRRDYRVLGATRASQGLEIMAREPVHIVMSDQCMPEMTGVEFLSRLRERYPDTVRLLFTAYADIKAVISAINQGNVYRYITKPWEPEDLQSVLKQASERYDLLAERKRLLRELKQKNEQLQAANAELQQANDLKKAFIKVASHELRTPLTIVMGLAELAKNAGGLPPATGEWIERIYLGSERLNERVDKMVKMLMADEFDKPLRKTRVEIGELLGSAAAAVATFINQRGQRLDLSAPGDLGTVVVDADKIRDAVLQLLINAVKFTPDAGVIRLGAKRTEEGGLAIQVSDTGVGMDAENLARVFEPFFTSFDVSRHRSGEFEFARRGLGLGLSVVKAFVEMHGGTVTVESESGAGSTFTILLPAEND